MWGSPPQSPPEDGGTAVLETFDNNSSIEIMTHLNGLKKHIKILDMSNRLEFNPVLLEID